MAEGMDACLVANPVVEQQPGTVDHGVMLVLHSPEVPAVPRDAPLEGGCAHSWGAKGVGGDVIPAQLLPAPPRQLIGEEAGVGTPQAVACHQHLQQPHSWRSDELASLSPGGRRR